MEHHPARHRLSVRLSMVAGLAEALVLALGGGACGSSDIPCSVDSECPNEPTGDPCAEWRCDATKSVCARQRTDRDRDGFAPVACAGSATAGAPATDCDDTRASAAPDAAETCNRMDDDCDGEIDEQAAASSLCATVANTTIECRDGVCEVAGCHGSYEDCNRRATDGCETDVSIDPRHCGACGVACPEMPGVTACAAGLCTCAGALPAVCGGVCVDTATSSVHCGACGVVCSIAAGFSCIEGTCACPEGRVDCGGACRDTRRDVDACGRCGVACAVGQTCEDGVCTGRLVGLTVGDRHACALRSNGRVVCWGANDVGQLGDGSLAPSTRPREVGTLEDVTQVVASASHTCARTRDGEIFCWGDGDGVIEPGVDIGPQTLPVRVTAALPSSLTDLDVGTGGIATTDGSVVVRWDAGTDDSSIALVNVQLDLGARHGCVLETRPGPVSCWGDNEVGQLGRGSFEPANDLAAARTVGIGNASWLAAGGTATCAVIDDGRVRCWGAGRHTPSRVDERADGGLIELQGVVGVTTTSGHACAWRAAGTVVCWGIDDSGQLGRGGPGAGTSWAEPVVDLTSATLLEAGGASTCALARGGEAYCWGANDEGQIGDGTTTQRSRPTLVVGL
ncbi:MAG: hypothetical protein IT379_16520 [Deltaproteobacteria bacterium]|nr:hypothetical protein [Deltaproteobacteria bacterium]